MIVKVQRPTMPIDGDWLVKNEDGSLVRAIPSDEVTQAARRFIGGRYRVYCEAELDGDDVLLIARLRDQGW